MEHTALSKVVSGEVIHHRHHPVSHRFCYPMFFMLLNLDELDDLNSWVFGVNRKRVCSFLFSDHGNGEDPRQWVPAVLESEGVTGCDRRIWVQTMPRVFGYLFNPVSFWYCENSEGEIGAIIAEVNNTFGDRHCYVLTPNPVNGRFHHVVAEKVMHVSPFYTVEGQYQFSFNVRFNRPAVVIDYHHHQVKQLHTAIHGVSRAWSPLNWCRVLLKQPFLTIGVMVRIHWQAFCLWIKGVHFYGRIHPTNKEISR